MKRPYLIPLAVLCCAGIAYAAGSISVTGYPAVPRTLKGGTGVNIAPDGTFSATGDAVANGTQPFQNLSGALRGKYLPIAGTAVNAANAQAYKGTSAPSATEFSYLQGVTSRIQDQLTGKANTADIALVGTTGQYSDLSGKPTIPSALSELSGDTTHMTVTDTEKSTWNGKQAALGYTAENAANKGTANGYPSLDSGGKVPSAQIPTLNQNTTGTAAGLTAQYIDWSLTSGGASIKNKPTLSTVATSGNYSDLNGKPAPYTLPTASTIVKGGVMVDGSSIQIDGGGVIHSTVSAGVSSVNGYTGDIDLQTTDIVGFGSYSSSVNSRLAGKMDNVNPTFTGDMTTTNPDGTHYSNDYNTTSCPSGVAEGTKCTLPSGIWWYKSGAWTQAGLLPSYTLPAASAGTLGGVKVGSGLAVDGSGTLSAPSYTLPTAGPSTLGGVKVGTGLAVNGSGVLSATATGSGITVRAPFSGAQSVSVGNAYTTSAAATLTLSGHAVGTMSVKAKALTRIVPDAAGSYFTWSNPITDAVNTSSAGWSIDIPAGTYAVIDSDGTGAFQVKLTTKNLQTGVNEYTTPVPVASVSPSSIDFGSVTAGTTTAAISTVLTNAGTANLTTGTPTISGTDAARFAISANGCNAATVTPGNSCTESVTFTPTAAGSYSAQLNLPHNAAGSPIVVALTGTGTSGGGGSYLVSEDFETGALPSGWSNNSAVFGVTPPLSGSYSMSVVNGQYVTTSTFTAQPDIYVAALVKVSGALPSANGILRTADTGGNPLGIVSIRSTGKVQVGSVQSAGAVIVLDTPVYLKMRATAGTGSNAVVSVWSSATGLAGSWTLQATDSAGTWTANAVKALVKSTSGESSALHTVDRLRISATDINY